MQFTNAAAMFSSNVIFSEWVADYNVQSF